MNNTESTELKIKSAAKDVFLKKGFKGCTTREIAKKAGMNVALVNYYFRSKEQLFQVVFNTVMEEFLTGMVEVFSAKIALKEKVEILIDREFEFYSKNPELPGFVLNEIGKNPSFADENKNAFNRIQETGIFQEAIEAQKAGIMRELDMFDLTMLIMSNCQFPFISKNLMSSLMELSPDELHTKTISYKSIVSSMLLSYIFIK